jgi:hypothetical protein
MKRIYIAGPYSGNDILTILSNIRNGIKLAVRVLQHKGFSPFCPWLDFLFDLVLEDGQKITIDDYYEYSMAWLEVSDAVLLMPGWKNSTGAIKEKHRAEQLNIPIYTDLEVLIKNME